MAWPHCGRILGRKIGSNFSAVSDTSRELWKVSAAGQGLVAKRGQISRRDDICGNSSSEFRERGSIGEVRESGNEYESSPDTHSCMGARPIGELRTSRQSFRRVLPCDGAVKHLHSSSIESEPSAAAAARTSDVTSPQLEGLDSLDEQPGARSVALAGVSGADFLQIENGESLYSGMASKELLAALFNLQLVSLEPMVDLSLKVFTSRLMKLPLTSVPILWLVKRTAFSHFCSGEDAVELAVTVNRMWDLGLKGILDYSLEDAEDNESCRRNYAGFLNTIRKTRSMPQGSVSLCVKISALCPIGLMERVSDLLRWQNKNPGFRLPWKQDSLPVLAPESPSYQNQAPEPLTPEEDRDWLEAQQRSRQLCEACAEVDIPILIDAEYSSIQPAVDYITYVASLEFNKAGRAPIVYGTMQAYLKDAPARLSLALTEASKRNVSLAVKLVRGAYITRETSVAASLGVPSPIHGCIEDTHHCYDSCASMMLERVASGNSAVMIATHNCDSGRFAALKAEELGLDKADPRVQFAQLKGMADSLSLALVHAGFNVSKYLPFGPIEHVIPYLVRRAEENRGLLGNTLADRQRLRRELGRRFGVAVGLKQ